MIKNNSTALILDKELYDIFDHYNQSINMNLLDMDRKISKILYKYFYQSPDVFSTYICTNFYIFGSNNNMYLPIDGFNNSQLSKYSREARGKLIWIPTYDFVTTFDQQHLIDVAVGYRYLFSAVQDINLVGGDKTDYYSNLGKMNYSITLLINFNESFFQNILDNSISIKGSNYYIISDKGNIVFRSDGKHPATKENPTWLSVASYNKAGTTLAHINGEEKLICFNTSKVTGWITAASIPLDQLLARLNTIKFYIIFIWCILTVLSLILAFLISGKITRPINNLVAAMKNLGEGKFISPVKIISNNEIGYLTSKFNEMDWKIHKLIEENYKTAIREKEAQIMALNIQLNPHFLYNYLNTINWMAIQNEQNEISDMLVNLSTMLQYTTRNKDEIVDFKDDLEWLKSYVNVMSKRYEGIFIIKYDIDILLLDYKVPKLFLQPFIENAMIHGFEEIEKGGIIIISGSIDNNFRFFRVEDNGKGMNQDKIDVILHSDPGSIGISNVNKRIKLLYGDEYGVQIESEFNKGTKVTICMPLEN